MRSSRGLGVIALSAILVAAVSFAVVDVTVSGACGAASCVAGIPAIALVFAALGGLAALVSILPAVTWIVDAIRTARAVSHEDDRELARAARPRAFYPEEEA